MDIPKGSLYLGGIVDPASHERTGEPVLYDSADLTTHGVIVGMTGSGKTGLGVCLLEDALLSGIPTLVLDPKGDMGNLLLTFPELAPADFEPWIDPAAAARDGQTVAEAAVATAETWRSGLAGWEIGPERIAQLRRTADFSIYTPGSRSGVALNILGSLDPPGGEVDEETRNDEVEGLASSLLGLIGIDADPLSSREHILITNLVHDAWSKGEALDLAGLITRIQQPPLRKLGVIDLDSFFPPKDRMELALKLNGLAASPAFASWIAGEPLDIGAMLTTTDGRPRCAIVSVAHLSDEERQFVVTLVLAKVVSWMRSLPGTSELRALIYMDEVFGFVPPSAMPPAKKPILTIFKQARAFGVGMVLSTQNPVDIDYKAIANAGTWMIGRLQTERDKARLLEGMTSAGGSVDIAAVDATLSSLGKREFVLHSAKASAPRVFATRWAMSYLAGPLTRDQIATLMADRATVTTAAPPAATAEAMPPPPAGAMPPPPAPEETIAEDESPAPPPVAEGVRVYHLDPAAPWAADIGVVTVSGSARLEPALVARVNLLYDETSADLRHEAEWEALWFPLSDPLDPATIRSVDYDDRDLRSEAPAGARYALPDRPLSEKGLFRDAETTLKDHLYRNQTLALHQNTELRLASRVDETEEEFRARCATEADNRADADADKLRSSLGAKLDRAREAIAKAEDKVREAEHDSSSRGRDEVLSGVGDILGGLLGGRKSTRSILSDLRRAGSKRRAKDTAQERKATAENRLAEEIEDLEALETDLVEKLEGIQSAWDAKAAAVTSLEVPLEKTDIRVQELALLWIPRPG